MEAESWRPDRTGIAWVPDENDRKRDECLASAQAHWLALSGATVKLVGARMTVVRARLALAYTRCSLTRNSPAHTCNFASWWPRRET